MILPFLQLLSWIYSGFAIIVLTSIIGALTIHTFSASTDTPATSRESRRPLPRAAPGVALCLRDIHLNGLTFIPTIRLEEIVKTWKGCRIVINIRLSETLLKQLEIAQTTVHGPNLFQEPVKLSLLSLALNLRSLVGIKIRIFFNDFQLTTISLAGKVALHLTEVSYDSVMQLFQTKNPRNAIKIFFLRSTPTFGSIEDFSLTDFPLPIIFVVHWVQKCAPFLFIRILTYLFNTVFQKEISRIFFKSDELIEQLEVYNYLVSRQWETITREFRDNASVSALTEGQRLFYDISRETCKGSDFGMYGQLFGSTLIESISLPEISSDRNINGALATLLKPIVVLSNEFQLTFTNSKLKSIKFDRLTFAFSHVDKRLICTFSDIKITHTARFNLSSKFVPAISWYKTKSFNLAGKCTTRVFARSFQIAFEVFPRTQGIRQISISPFTTVVPQIQMDDGFFNLGADFLNLLLKRLRTQIGEVVSELVARFFTNKIAQQLDKTIKRLWEELEYDGVVWSEPDTEFMSRSS